MAKFLNTSGITHYLEQLITHAKKHIILISPYLKLNARFKEILQDKINSGTSVQIVYGKQSLTPSEADWLDNLPDAKLYFCKNLHAKCYLSESYGLITSMNLYEFSQVNNNEMGIIFGRKDDPSLFRDAYAEAERLIRISDDVTNTEELIEAEMAEENTRRVSTSQLAKKLGIRPKDLFQQLLERQLIYREDDQWRLTESGIKQGGQTKSSKRFGEYITWPSDLTLS